MLIFNERILNAKVTPMIESLAYWMDYVALSKESEDFRDFD